MTTTPCFGVPRAAAFEDRIRARIVDPGVMRVGDSWTAILRLRACAAKWSSTGSKNVYKFGSNQRVAANETVALRWVGSEQGLEFASEGLSTLVTEIAALGYVALMSGLGIMWAVADRKWLVANPSMQPSRDSLPPGELSAGTANVTGAT